MLKKKKKPYRIGVLFKYCNDQIWHLQSELFSFESFSNLGERTVTCLARPTSWLTGQRLLSSGCSILHTVLGVYQWPTCGGWPVGQYMWNYVQKTLASAHEARARDCLEWLLGLSRGALTSITVELLCQRDTCFLLLSHESELVLPARSIYIHESILKH